MTRPQKVDVLVVGSGPAGVSACAPLLAAGLRVAMVDGGRGPDVVPPHGEYLDARTHDADQADWMLGRYGEALGELGASSSPKMRVPTLGYVFRDFAAANRIETDAFVGVGSLAAGGLTNAWGCGVARFDRDELADFPFDDRELDESYARIARRIGLSGAAADDLRDYFGVDDCADPAIESDALHHVLFSRYASRRAPLRAAGFALGRARLAVLARDDGARRGCTRSGFCLWGCAERSMYTAAFDLDALRRQPGFSYRPGELVACLERRGEQWSFTGPAGAANVEAPTVILAAGPLATTAIALRTLGDHAERRLLSAHSAAFALWLPRQLGARRAPAPGFAQGAYTLDDAGGRLCGFTFSTQGLPLIEFVRGTGWSRRSAAGLLRAVLSSTIVANVFLPGVHSANRVRLRADGALEVTGGVAPGTDALLARTATRLRRSFRSIGAVMLPGSFRAGAIGADAHYAGSLPMRAAPSRGETDGEGALAGLPGVYVADASAMPTLPAKSHTFTMMACADRLARRLASRLAVR